MSAPSEARVREEADRVPGSGFSARIYDPVLWLGEKTGLARKRGRLLAGAQGEVLEIGAGTGLNLAHYPAGLERLVMSEPDEHKAELMRDRAAALGVEAEFARASSEALPFEDDSFDTVVATLVFCTVAEPEVAIAELKRVLRSGGSWIFLEHVRSEHSRIAWIQDRIEAPWAKLAGGCRCNRRTIELIEAGGFGVEIAGVADKWLMPPTGRPMISGVARPLSA